MSAAVTSGVVALILQRHNQSGYRRQLPLTANLVKAMLEYSAIPVAGADPLTQGAGEINAAGAIALAGAIDTAVSSGRWWLGTGVSPSTTIGTSTYAWGRNVIWKDSLLGGNLLYVSNIVWSTNIVWGTSALVEASNIVWGTSDGDNIVWGTAADGDNIVWGTAVPTVTPF